jgi:Flp pilus assembly protein TadG
MSSRPQRLLEAEAGAAAVEAAIVMSGLLLALVGTVECARALWTTGTMLVAVEQAGRYAMTYNHRLSAVCAAQIQAPECPAASNTPAANCSASFARQILLAYQAAGVAVSAAEDATTSPATITLCASYSFDFIASQLMPWGPMQFITRATVPVL